MNNIITKNIITEIKKVFDIKKINMQKPIKGKNNDVYISTKNDDFKELSLALHENKFELTSLFCAQNFEKKEFTLFYVFEKKSFKSFAILTRVLNNNKTDSIASIYPSACWYEREITDGFGIEFDDAFDKRKLFLHEPYPKNFHPLLKSFKNQTITRVTKIKPSDEYQFRKVKGEGVYQIPVGPVHAGIIEPGHFRFSVIGETIFNLEIRMFWNHKGIEKLAEGKTPETCIKIAETISGDESVTNAVAFCIAVEKISNITIPKRASYLRTILLEMERIYSLISDLAGMMQDIAYPVGASPFFTLREELFRQNENLTGSRFMKNIMTIGGLKKDIQNDALETLSSYLEHFTDKFNKAKKVSRTSSFSVFDRLETTGVVKKELLEPLHITGPIAKASGINTDTRKNHPYGQYDTINIKTRILEKGDVLSRFDLKAEEIIDSVKIIQDAIINIPKDNIITKNTIKDGYALSVVESPRGQNVHWIYIKNGLIDRYKIRTASFCNWKAIEHAVIGNIVPDFPLINKSMNLSYSGTDL